MEPNKILSANILDLIFDDRNKEYGAYDLRVTYPERIKKSLLFVFAIAAVTITGATLAGSFKPEREANLFSKEVTITEIEPDKKEVIPPPEIKKPDPPQTKTEKLTTEFKMVKEEEVDPLPTQEDFKNADVGLAKNDGPEDIGLTKTNVIDDHKGIIEPPKNDEPDIYPIVQIPAKFDGDWVKFLTRNLNANTPVDNGAPAGRYNVIMQFVVDKEGNLSDIKALTDYGFGMEQEAIRVLKKAKGWKPGIQNGREVKSYHKQPITFIVEEQ
jgi:periplasmic protein TonB